MLFEQKSSLFNCDFKICKDLILHDSDGKNSYFGLKINSERELKVYDKKYGVGNLDRKTLQIKHARKDENL